MEQVVMEGAVEGLTESERAAQRESIEARALSDHTENQRELVALRKQKREAEDQDLDPNPALDTKLRRTISMTSFAVASQRASENFVTRSRARMRWTKAYVFVKRHLKQASDENGDFRQEMEKVEKVLTSRITRLESDLKEKGRTIVTVAGN